MGNGVNLGANNNLMSTADICGQKVLGMSGSLVSYINTGVATPLDNFTKTSTKVQNKKEKKKIDFNSIIKASVVVLGLASAGCMIFTNRNKIFNADFANKIKNLFKKANKAIIEEANVAPKALPEPVEVAVETQETIKKRIIKKPKALKGKYVEKKSIPAVREAVVPKIQYIPPYQRSEQYGEDILVDLIEKQASKASQADIVENVIEETVPKALPEPTELVVEPQETIKKRIIKKPKASKGKYIQRKAIHKTQEAEEFYLDENNPLLKRFFRRPDSLSKNIKIILTELKAKILEQMPSRKQKVLANLNDDTFTPVDLIKEKHRKQAKLDKIIDEVKSWKNLSDTTDDFELTLDKCKKAMVKPAGAALSILEEEPKVVLSETRAAEAKKIAKQLQEEYHKGITKSDYRLPDKAFEDLECKYVWQPGDTFRIYDPEARQNIGVRYKINEDQVAEPQIPKRPR